MASSCAYNKDVSVSAIVPVVLVVVVVMAVLVSGFRLAQLPRNAFLSPPNAWLPPSMSSSVSALYGLRTCMRLTLIKFHAQSAYLHADIKMLIRERFDIDAVFEVHRHE